MKWRYLAYLIPLALLLVLAAFLGAGLGQDPKLVPSPLIGKAAPQFKLQQLADPARGFEASSMKGQVWLLNVWASWCVSCREEHSLLMALHDSGRVPVYGLDYEDTRTAALTWLSDAGNPYVLTASDPNGQVGMNYGVYGVPETYVIDKRGVIRYKQIGPLTPDVLEHKILPLVAELSR